MFYLVLTFIRILLYIILVIAYFINYADSGLSGYLTYGIIYILVAGKMPIFPFENEKKRIISFSCFRSYDLLLGSCVQLLQTPESGYHHHNSGAHNKSVGHPDGENGFGNFFLFRYTNVKCVSKVLGHLSKPAAPTSVPGLLRHILYHYFVKRLKYIIWHTTILYGMRYKIIIVQG